MREGVGSVKGVGGLEGEEGFMGGFTSASDLINSNNNYSYDELGKLIKDEQENIQQINWRNDGKISSIIRGTGGTESSLIFTYDPMCQRLSKEIYDENDEWVETTYYIRDPQVRNFKGFAPAKL